VPFACSGVHRISPLIRTSQIRDSSKWSRWIRVRPLTCLKNSRVYDQRCRTNHRFYDSSAHIAGHSSYASDHHSLSKRNTRVGSQAELRGFSARPILKVPAWVSVPMPEKRTGRVSACSEMLQRTWDPARIEIVCVICLLVAHGRPQILVRALTVRMPELDARPAPHEIWKHI